MKVGEYARLNNTLYDTVVILKITEVYDNTILTENDGSIYQGEYGVDEVINHSYNIIDLIEVGDFIKYNPVQNHYAKKITLYKAIKDEKDLFFLKYQVQNDKLKILSIVTKEQFESMEYKVGE